jgi:1,4-dihydroxy-2-naphthoate polyprenyltransferase
VSNEPAAQSGAPVATPPPPGPVKRWVLGARPRTLPAAVVPVFVGTACGWWLSVPKGQYGWVAYAPLSRASQTGPSSVLWHFQGIWATGEQGFHWLIWWRFACALIVALAIQIGTNYANDYSDGVRGTDQQRVGPLRLVGSGLVPARTVKMASFISFGVAAVAGLLLAAYTSWWLLPVGAVCFLAGWFYTGGPKPYGYLGLGELFVFVFFGVVATVGSAYVQRPHLFLAAFPGYSSPLSYHYLNWLALWAAIPVGLLATALLEANNLRDISGDVVANKKTLAVRLGRRRAGWLYLGSLMGVAVGICLVAIIRPFALIALLALPLAIKPSRLVMSDAEGRQLLPVLAATGRLQLAVGILLTVGILV